MALTWHDWNDEVLAVAREERRPILLFLVASWAQSCRRMERGVLADPAVAAAIADHAIAVRADKDAHPELVALYGQGAWPTTAIVDANGRLLFGATWVDAPALTAALADAARRVRGEPEADAPTDGDGAAGSASSASDAADAGAPSGPPRADATSAPRPPHAAPAAHPVARRAGPSLDERVLPAIEEALLSSFDERHGGFGSGAKFPHPEALDFAILRYAGAPSPRLWSVIEKTLTHMAAGPLQDQVDGGFFRFSENRDWTRPHTEKPLTVNAGLARNYLEAGQVMGRSDFLITGARTVDALLRDFLVEDAGLFVASLPPDDDFYALDAAGRRTRNAPPRELRFVADANARAIAALLKAGAVLGRPGLTGLAVRVARRLIERLWRPGRGVFHFDDGHGPKLPGRLRDQAEVARALLRVVQYTDARAFLPILDDLLRVIATAHVRPDGDFADRDAARADRAAQLDEQTFHDGAVAAEVLLRGALFTGRRELRGVARRALERRAGDFLRFGWAISAYGRSVELLRHPPLHVVIVGRAGDLDAEALLDAASATYQPSRVVQRLDPIDDAGQLHRLGLPMAERATAYVFTARDVADAHDPPTLRRILRSASARRLGG